MIKVGIAGMGIHGSLFADTLMQNMYAEIEKIQAGWR